MYNVQRVNFQVFTVCDSCNDAVSFFLAHSAIQRAVFHNFGFGVEHLSCQSSKVVGEGDEKVR